MLARILAILLLPLTAWAGNELGHPISRNFAAREYRQHTQNWAAVQGPDGMMYFGNRAVVMAFDGNSWQPMPVPNTAYVRGMAYSPDGRLYVGAVNQLGYFRLDAAGGKDKEFVSLQTQLPPEARDFRDIWSVTILPDGVCFESRQQLMLWHDEKFTVLPLAATDCALPDGDALYVNGGDGVFKKLAGGKLETVSTDPFFQRGQLAFAHREPDGTLLLGSFGDGLFRLAKNGAVSSVKTDVDGLLRREKLRGGRRLPDGSLALALQFTGLVLLDRDGHFQYRLDVASGLQNPVVRAIVPDREGGLWLCLNAGITRVEWPPVVTVFDDLNGLNRTQIRDVVRFNGVFYLVMDSGILRLDGGASAEGDALNPRFLPVPMAGGTPPGTPLLSLLATPHGLLTATANDLYAVEEGKLRRLLPLKDASYRMSASRHDPERVYVGLSRGVEAVRFSGSSAVDEGLIPGLDTEVRSIVEEKDGSLWVSSTSHGFFHVSFPDGTLASAKVKRFPGGRGLREKLGISYVQKWDDRVIFSTDDGLFTYNAGRDVFLPVTELKMPPGINLNTQGLNQPDHAWLRTSSDNGQWNGRQISRVTPDGRDGKWESLPYMAADLVGDSQLFYEENGVLWIPGTDALVRVELANAFRKTPIPKPRLVATGVLPGEKLPWSGETLTFNFATPSFRTAALLEYQTQLAGIEKERRPWSAERSRTFTALPEGDYTFQVRARNSDGQVSDPATFSFTILPPWWRAWWAWSGYALLGIAGCAAAVRWRGRVLRARNRQLEAVVTARTAELLVARDHAETASRAKSAFLANMSHELRTPLNAILGYARILKQDETLPAASRQRAGVINESGSHLLSVINDVLDLSKIEAEKLTLHPTPFALVRMLNGVVDVFRPLAFEKGLEFQANFASDLSAAVIGDEYRLRQVLFNLLGNALKFTPAGGIEFVVRRVSGGKVLFQVTDSGVGIAPEQLQAIFLPFHQAHDATFSSQGTGLGLTISQRIVDLMGGSLEVESLTGQGSRFWFEAAFEETSGSDGVDTRQVTGYLGSRRRLLVVDDEAANRDVLLRLLQPLGFEIYEAIDGLDCLEKLPSVQPDAVLLDLRMPGLDGFATARRLRASAGPSLPIIAVSASVFESNRQDAIDAGCDDFLSKPIQMDRALAVLTSMLKLEWTYRESRPEPMLDPLPAAMLEELYALSLLGDVQQLRERLAAFTQSAPRYTTSLQILDALAARFQMKRIRDLLLEQKSPAA